MRFEELVQPDYHNPLCQISVSMHFYLSSECVCEVVSHLERKGWGIMLAFPAVVYLRQYLNVCREFLCPYFPEIR